MIAADERLKDWEIDLERRATEQVTDHDWGQAFINPSLPLIWDANWVLIEQPGLDFEEIREIAAEVLGGHGMEHRTVLVADLDAGEAMVPDVLATPGWSVERGVRMVLRGPPDREPEAEVREVGQDEIEPLRRELIRAGLPGSLRSVAGGGSTEETIDQLLGWDRRLGAAGGDRWFAAELDGKPASACRLLSMEGTGVGQVEDVGTLEPARGNGLARAVTMAAARASAADGNEVTFLGALADDWPRLMYAKLGFELLRENVAFRRRPGR
jgi:hypothetical protein